MKHIYNYQEYIKEQKILSYYEVTEKQEEGDPYFDGIFSNETSEFVEETIHIVKLRELNGFSNDREDELEQTVSYFKELDFTGIAKFSHAKACFNS